MQVHMNCSAGEELKPLIDGGRGLKTLLLHGMKICKVMNEFKKRGCSIKA